MELFPESDSKFRSKLPHENITGAILHVNFLSKMVTFMKI